jgi:hypothetical protein
MHVRSILALVVTASGPALGQLPFDFDTRVGLAFVAGADSGCLAIRAPALAAGTRLLLVDDGDPPAVFQASVERPRSVACPAEGAGETGDDRYAIRARGAARLPPFGVLIAVVVDGRALTVGGDGVSGDLDGDGTPEHFRSCTSAEGLHFTIWSGPPLTGRRRWHRYHYLGYDVEPSCTEADVGP